MQADFTDLTTVYVTISGDTGVYVKFGLMSVDVETNESLATGGSYNDTSLDGQMIGIGYARDLDNGAFFRVEGNLMDLDGVTLVNTADSDKSVKVDGISGYGARISVGKSF